MEQEHADALLMRAVALEAEVVGAPEAGRRSARDVLHVAHRERHPEATVLALRAIGQAGRLLGEYDDASRSLDRAVVVARRHGLDDRLVQVLLARAGLRLERGRVHSAERDLAAARARATGAVAELEFLQGRLEEEAGHVPEAAASYRRALQMAGAAPPELRLKILNELAVFEGLLGRHHEAERRLLQALEVANGIGPVAKGIVTHNLGWVALRNGHVVDALHWFETAEEQLAAGGLALTEHELDEIVAFRTMRLAAEGLELATRVVASLERAGNQLVLAQARLQEAELFLLADRPGEAARAADVARDLFRRQGRAMWAARASGVATEARLAAGVLGRADLARCEHAATDLEAAGYAQEAADVRLVSARVALALHDDQRADVALRRTRAVAGGSLPQRLRGWVAAALLARQRGDLVGVRRAAARGLRELDVYRSTLGSTELRALASGHGQELGTLGLAAALASNRTSLVFAWMERGRVRSLLAPSPPRTDAHLTTALAELRLLRQQVDGDPTLAPRVARLEARVRRLARLERGATVGLAQPVTLHQLRPALAGGAFIEIGEHDGALHAVVATRARLHRLALGSVARVEEELGYLAASLRRLGRSGSSDATAARAMDAARAALTELDDLLLGPLDRVLDTATALVVSPPPALMAVPWGSLATARDRPVAVTPAAALWLRARGSEAERPRRRVSLVAGPGLRAAPDEVASVSRLYGDPVVLMPAAATVDAVLAALEAADVAHLACHATFRRDNPMFSSLELADGPLVVHDVEQLAQPPCVLVLAACNSGLSEHYPGEELLGFLSVLLSAGTESLIASVVPVPDVDTVPFMTKLHTGMAAGVSPSSALASARSAADGSPASFLASCAFSCFGAG